jgi:S1-C subfamily serine protease
VNLKHAHEDYHPAMVRFVVTTGEGDESVGSGFHIGSGWVVTARHVLEEHALISARNEWNKESLVVGSVHFHDNDKIDLAVVETDLRMEHYLQQVTFSNDERRNQAKTDHIPIGGHLDDWVGDEFVLSKALVMAIHPFLLRLRSGSCR